MEENRVAEIIDVSEEQMALLEDLMERAGIVPDDGGSAIPRLSQKRAPLSFAQQGLWFLEQFQPGTPLYNLPLAIRLDGALIISALEQALSQIVRRHEALRTVIALEDGTPLQLVLEPQPVALAVTELTGLEEFQNKTRPPTRPSATLSPHPMRGEGRERGASCRLDHELFHGGTSADAERARQWLEARARGPFDLLRGPLFRAHLLRCRPEEHVLLLVMHHIVSDAGSLDILYNEVAQLYEAIASGKTVSWPSLPIQYADFARWQRERMRLESAKSHLDYWRKQLADPPAGLKLPTGLSPPASRRHNGALESLELPLDLSAALRTFSQREAVTPFMTLFGAFQTLLQIYSSQDDILIGSPFSHRVRMETEGVAGFFVNTVALRADLSGNPTFLQLLARVRETVLQASAHLELPFEQVVTQLQPERNLHQHPLFQVMFSYERESKKIRNAAGLTLTPIDLHTGVAKFDLTLSIVEREGEWKALLEFDTDLFELPAAARMLNHYQTLLQSILANPAARLSELTLLGEEEKSYLLRELNETRREFPASKLVHQLLEEQARRTPERVAVVFEDRQLTYEELTDRAAQLARHLEALGVGPEVRVGIFMERSLEMVVALIGVLKAGGAYLPLDLRYPKDRLAYLLSDARPAVILAQREWLSDLPSHEAKIVCLGPEDDAPGGSGRRTAHDSSSSLEVLQGTSANCSSSSSSPAVTTDANLAYVLYTSGSTGRPKGVEVSHRSVVNFLLSMREQPGLSSEDVLLAVTPLSFDIAGLELFLPLSVGARVVITGESVSTDPEQLAAAIEAYGVTVMQATPATWRLLLQSVSQDSAGQGRAGFQPACSDTDRSGSVGRKDDGPALETHSRSAWAGHPHLKILCGGEALPRELALELLKRCGSLWNLYGPTETTIWSAVGKVEAADSSVAIGCPIANTSIYLLDRIGRPVPLAVPGELYIGGEGVARGYSGRPDLTAARFVPDPFGTTPGARLYRTGDLARYRPDGAVEFLGRVDHQVKVRGYRIELTEVESVIGQHPAVSECVVTARSKASGEQQLVGYVALKHPAAATGKSLYEFLRRKLPLYMVPAAFVFLDRLPRTPNGKINRAALPLPGASHRVRAKRYAAPRTSAEKKLAAIWVDVLEADRIGVHDNFFELGGHSLLATQVISRIAEEFKVVVSVASFFEAPTIGELALRLAQNQTTHARTEPGIHKRRTASEASRLLAKLDQLSEAEVEALLAQEIRTRPDGSRAE
ncbi:MAG: AMP-binding protein [Verrucomicrobia bacterium]|nr:AMP-binding protein [Verrucomicrobiota bacterium]